MSPDHNNDLIDLTQRCKQYYTTHFLLFFSIFNFFSKSIIAPEPAGVNAAVLIVVNTEPEPAPAVRSGSSSNI